jgi:hypothetical protein
VSDFDADWAAFSEELWRRRSPYLLTLDGEAKVSHFDDLRARLADAGLGPTDLAAAAGDRKLLAKARRRSLTSRSTVAAT